MGGVASRRGVASRAGSASACRSGTARWSWRSGRASDRLRVTRPPDCGVLCGPAGGQGRRTGAVAAMRIGIDGGCLANRRGFGRFARQTLEALAEAGRAARVRGLRRPAVGRRGRRRPARGSSGSSSTVGEAPSRAASAAGRRRVARHARHGPRRRAGGRRPDLLPGDVQLLPRLERQAGRRHDARHARPGPPRAGLPDLARAARLGAQGARRGPAGPTGS